MTEGPPGVMAEAAYRILADHSHNQTCRQCDRLRCWMLEWALRTVIGERVPPEHRKDATATLDRAIAGADLTAPIDIAPAEQGVQQGGDPSRSADHAVRQRSPSSDRSPPRIADRP
ncbi:hypothetical protein [Plantactinospora sp. CA-290183]|uniref:hypothetical protein n=1 Tax=Plantactinospora sp. CA-290183 TaxID=3240006 RepID=UPI003D8B30F4